MSFKPAPWDDNDTPLHSLLIMYESYFGCAEKPFSIAPDARFLYLSAEHKEALAHLLYGLEFGNFTLLTGEVGAGKTMLCRSLSEQAPKNCDIALAINPKLDAQEMLAVICDEFGVQVPDGDVSTKVLIDCLNSYLLDAHAKGRNCALIVDEAQNLSPETLEQLRLLTNLETSERKLLQIILVGQAELLELLEKPQLRQLAQRIDARFHLEKLSKSDLPLYVAHRLRIAKAPQNVFPARLMPLLYRLSKGIPRLVNIICERALMGAYAEGSSVVTRRILSRAARETSGKSWGHGKVARIVLTVGGMLCLGGALSAAALYGYNNYLGHELARGQEDAWLNGANGGRSAAFAALFKRWGVVWDAADGAACQTAIQYGLVCERREGNIGSIRRLNRPAVLENLIDAEGRSGSVSLLGLRRTSRGEIAQISVATKMLDVPLRELESHWLGGYTLLWKPPPGYYQAVNLTRGESPSPTLADWLTNTRAALGESDAQPLSKWLADFQRANHLLADGILGPQTLMHVNRKLGIEAPSLIPSQ